MHRLFFRIYSKGLGVFSWSMDQINIDSPEVPGLKLMAFNACDDGGVSP